MRLPHTPTPQPRSHATAGREHEVELAVQPTIIKRSQALRATAVALTQQAWQIGMAEADNGYSERLPGCQCRPRQRIRVSRFDQRGPQLDQSLRSRIPAQREPVA